MSEVTGGYRFAVTGYAGFEDDILRFRNANRATAPKTRRYMDWRYEVSAGSQEPMVFWLISEEGRRMGMASLIPRPYWIEGRLVHMAVLGDISLDATARGKGIGRALLQFLSKYLDDHLPDSLGFVIPNEAARRTLTATGWQAKGTLLPYVFLLSPERKLLRFVKNQRLARIAALLYKHAVHTLLRSCIQSGCSIEVVDEPDDSFEALWRELPKEALLIVDKGVASLLWRFTRHPDHNFKFAKLTRRGEFLGYVVFELSSLENTCFIYDLLIGKPENLACLVGAFALHCSSYQDIDTIRLALSDTHPHRRKLWRLGFIPRKAQGVFQVYGRDHAMGMPARWAVTLGDKDV